MADFEPTMIAIVRDIHQRDYRGIILNPRVRDDGWVMDPSKREWYSPDNVISLSTYTPRKWDGNALKPGTLCEIEVWQGTTSARPTGYETEICTIIQHDTKRRAYIVLTSEGQRLAIRERRLVPIMVTPG